MYLHRTFRILKSNKFWLNTSKVIWITYILLLIILASSLLNCARPSKAEELTEKDKPPTEEVVSVGDNFNDLLTECPVLAYSLNVNPLSYNFYLTIIGGMLGGALSFAYRNKYEDVDYYLLNKTEIFYYYKYIPDSLLGILPALVLSGGIKKVIAIESSTFLSTLIVASVCGFFFKLLLDGLYAKIHNNLPIERISLQEQRITTQESIIEYKYLINRSLCFLNANKTYSAIEILSPDRVSSPSYKVLNVRALCKLEHAISIFKNQVYNRTTPEDRDSDFNVALSQVKKYINCAIEDIEDGLESSTVKSSAKFGLLIRYVNILIIEKLIEDDILDFDNKLLSPRLLSSISIVKSGYTLNPSKKLRSLIKDNRIILTDFKKEPDSESLSKTQAIEYMNEEGRYVKHVIEDVLEQHYE